MQIRRLIWALQKYYCFTFSSLKIIIPLIVSACFFPPLPHSYLILGICSKTNVQRNKDIQKLPSQNNSKHSALGLQSHVNVQLSWPDMQNAFYKMPLFIQTFENVLIHTHSHCLQCWLHF